MSRRHEALIYVADADRNAVVKAMTTLDLDLDIPHSMATLPVRGLDVAILSPDGLGRHAIDTLRNVAEAIARTPIVLFCGPTARGDLAQLLTLPNVVGVVGSGHPKTFSELAEAAAATVRGVRFGARALSGDAAPELHCDLTSNQDRDAILSAIASFCSDHGVRDRRARVLVDVAEELITNALYDAPTDPSGERVYARLDRRTSVELPSHQRCHVTVSCTADDLLVSVEDPFGSLDVLELKRYLARGLGAAGDAQIAFTKQGGAGLGLARIFHQADRIIVHVEPGVSTESTVMLNAHGRRRDSDRGPTGLLVSSPQILKRLRR